MSGLDQREEEGQRSLQRQLEDSTLSASQLGLVPLPFWILKWILKWTQVCMCDIMGMCWKRFLPLDKLGTAMYSGVEV